MKARKKTTKATAAARKAPKKLTAKKLTVKKSAVKKPAAKRSEYAQGKAAARDRAVEWQNGFSNRTMSWNELCREQAQLEKLGKRYGLTREFKENGII